MNIIINFVINSDDDQMEHIIVFFVKIIPTEICELHRIIIIQY